MERIDAILSRVLADVGAEFATEENALIREGSDEQRMLSAQLAGGSKKTTGDDEGLKSNNVICAADHPRPVERVSHPKTARAELFCGEFHAETPTWGSMERRNQVPVEGIRAHVRIQMPGNDSGPPLVTVDEKVRSS